MIINTQLSTLMEFTNEYIEDPHSRLARNDSQQYLRMKLKVTLQHKGTPCLLKNVQVHMGLPSNVYAEQTDFSFAEVDFKGSSTPRII